MNEPTLHNLPFILTHGGFVFLLILLAGGVLLTAGSAAIAFHLFPDTKVDAFYTVFGYLGLLFFGFGILKILWLLVSAKGPVMVIDRALPAANRRRPRLVGLQRRLFRVPLLPALADGDARPRRRADRPGHGHRDMGQHPAHPRRGRARGAVRQHGGVPVRHALRVRRNGAFSSIPIARKSPHRARRA